MRLLDPTMIRGLRSLCKFIRENNQPLGNPLVMVEIGCYIGESTSIFLRELPIIRMHCIDPWMPNSKYHKDDITLAYRIFQAQFSDSDRVFIHRTTSLEIPKIPFDVIYIDGSHKYEDVKADLLYWLPYSRPGAIICGHDYEDEGKFGVKKAVDEVLGVPQERFEDSSWAVIYKQGLVKKN